jgi:6-phosphogluconate dehydrogenase
MIVGIVGLGVMGRNLALNARDGGCEVVATDAWETARNAAPRGIEVVDGPAALVSALTTPRIVLLMVKAGDQVDVEIAGLAPYLAAGDILIDGGNSHYRDTERRARELALRGVCYLGVGISGGAEGARHGASIMVGGSEAAWSAAHGFLSTLAAEADDGAPTLTRFGDGGAGHFVKMAHNGVEYAIMQAISECHGLMDRVGGLERQATGDLLERWNANGRASGFLLEITAEIARTRDPLADGYLLEYVSDTAGQKGTGAWSIEAGLAHGVAIPSIMEAVSARQVSGQGGARATFAKVIGDRPPPDRADGLLADLEGDLEDALVASMIISLSQGLHLYAVAADQHGWITRLPDVLRVWRAGSILRMGLLDEMAQRLEAQPDASDPLSVSEIASDLASMLPAWRRIVGASVGAGFPAPVLATSLAYVEALGTKVLPTAVVQAQRDRFGAHGFARTDREGAHHGPWNAPDQEPPYQEPRA